MQQAWLQRTGSSSVVAAGHISTSMDLQNISATSVAKTRCFSVPFVLIVQRRRTISKHILSCNIPTRCKNILYNSVFFSATCNFVHYFTTLYLLFILLPTMFNYSHMSPCIYPKFCGHDKINLFWIAFYCTFLTLINVKHFYCRTVIFSN